jgi:hypothetical protein
VRERIIGRVKSFEAALPPRSGLRGGGNRRRGGAAASGCAAAASKKMNWRCPGSWDDPGKRIGYLYPPPLVPGGGLNRD